MSKRRAYSVTPEVLAMGQIHLTGNITPPIWFDRLRNASGKPNAVAVTILSEIVYWYRPKQIYDEATGKLIGMRSRFKDKKLQRSYQSFSDKFGFTKRQVQDACYFLRDKGLITLEPETLTLPDGSKLGNVLFIGVKPKAIQALTWIDLPDAEENTPHTLERISYPQKDTPYTLESTSSNDGADKLERLNVGAETVERTTYTEITSGSPTKITPETTLPPNPANGEKQEGGDKTGKREDGTNSRALRTNPRAIGTNPRALGTNPRATEEKPVTNSVSTPVESEIVEQSSSTDKDKGSAAAVTTLKKVSESTKWREERRREVHPNLVYGEGETPWLNPDGQFKAEFVRWVATEWMKKWTYSNVYLAEEAVISNFFNEPDKIPVRWRTYSLTFNHHFERAAQRIASGGTVQEEERQYLEDNLEAVRSPMPETIVSESKTLLGRDAQVAPALPPSPAPALPENFEGDPNTYQEWKPEMQISQEEAAANMRRLKEMIGNAWGKKKALPSEPCRAQNTLGTLQELLQDPILRADASVQRQAQKFVGESEDYCADYDENGLIVAIYPF